MLLDLPSGAAVVVLGPHGAALGRKVCDLLPAARLYGPKARPGDWDKSYERVVPLLAELFAADRPIVGLCAAGILIRALAPLVADKHAEPPVVALAEDGSVAVPLLGGHNGANAVARALAEAFGGAAAITTAGDLLLGFALDEPPLGWRIANPEQLKPTAAALLAGEPVALIDETCAADWLRNGRVEWAAVGNRKIAVTAHVRVAEPETLVFHPPVLAIGVGCERGCSAAEITDLAMRALADADLAPEAAAAIVSVDLKTDEACVHALAEMLGVPARFFPADRLLGETPRLTIRSEAAFRATGCWGVAEGAALAAVESGGALVVPRRQSRRATCAIALAPLPIDAAAIGRPRGRLAVIGIGPGDAAWRTPEASALLAASQDIVGYSLYLDLLGEAVAAKRRHDSAIGDEEARVRLALDLAASGGAVALVSSGDAGIYGLAALVFELVDREKRRNWSAVEIVVAPGVSAMQAAAARVGAPLGHDFCAISLSDLLTPWEQIEARIDAAARADFVIALYNPRSARRSQRIAEVAAILLTQRAPETPCLVARNVGRAGETRQIVRLDQLAGAEIDMLSLVLIGSRQTRLIAGTPLRLYTPRGYFG